MDLKWKIRVEYIKFLQLVFQIILKEMFCI